MFVLHRARKRKTQEEESQRISRPRRQAPQLEQRPRQSQPREEKPQQRAEESGPPELLQRPQEAQVREGGPLCLRGPSHMRDVSNCDCLLLLGSRECTLSFRQLIAHELNCVNLVLLFCRFSAATLRGEQGRKGPANIGMCLLLALNTSHQCNIKLCKVLTMVSVCL